ncbi:hypothetical protein [Halopiger djelfimassiliensis]|uniref:hypothetical protein n=1 Tax=Halopiger djelfimassiliensis TaxID=1293047 RepID=UPI0006775986|nr:hypothetical protein [Halopiger djelfimassiliensis]
MTELENKFPEQQIEIDSEFFEFKEKNAKEKVKKRESQIEGQEYTEGDYKIEWLAGSQKSILAKCKLLRESYDKAEDWFAGAAQHRLSYNKKYTKDILEFDNENKQLRKQFSIRSRYSLHSDHETTRRPIGLLKWLISI